MDASHNKVLTHFRMMVCNCEFVLIPAVENLKGNDMSYLMQAYSHEICPHGLITPQRIRGRSSESLGRDLNRDQLNSKQICYPVPITFVDKMLNVAVDTLKQGCS